MSLEEFLGRGHSGRAVKSEQEGLINFVMVIVGADAKLTRRDGIG